MGWWQNSYTTPHILSTLSPWRHRAWRHRLVKDSCFSDAQENLIGKYHLQHSQMLTSYSIPRCLPATAFPDVTSYSVPRCQPSTVFSFTAFPDVNYLQRSHLQHSQMTTIYRLPRCQPATVFPDVNRWDVNSHSVRNSLFEHVDLHVSYKTCSSHGFTNEGIEFRIG